MLCFLSCTEILESPKEHQAHLHIFFGLRGEGDEYMSEQPSKILSLVSRSTNDVCSFPSFYSRVDFVTSLSFIYSNHYLAVKLEDLQEPASLLLASKPVLSCLIMVRYGGRGTSGLPANDLGTCLFLAGRNT